MPSSETLESLIRDIENLKRRVAFQETIEIAAGAGCRVIRTSSQSIPDSTITPLSFDTEVNDQGGCWSIGTPINLVAPSAGYYIAGGGWGFDALNNANASRMVAGVYLNGATRLADTTLHTIAATLAVLSVVTGMFYMAASDYVQIIAIHSQGSTKSSLAGSTYNQHYCHGWLTKVGT